MAYAPTGAKGETTTRLNFGDKPAPDVATNAINTLAKLSNAEFPEAAGELRQHVYVDDIGGSRETVTKAKQIISHIDAVLAKGNFQIKTWHSNEAEIDQSNGERFTDLLGLSWDKQLDTFTFKKNDLGELDVLTKRRCLGLVGQLWDPIGLVLPVAIKFRIDLQGLWSSGYSWDDILPESIQQTWLENVQSINDLLSFQFDRKLKPNNAVGVPQIHGFSDGGEQAYGAVIFLRWKLAGGDYRSVPVTIKAFVAPLKKKSIPRLELLGCLALARIYVTCVKALEFTKAQDWERFFWINSSTVLFCFHSAAAEVCPELDQPGSEENPILLHLLKTCSTYSKIRRTLAYVGRFIHNARKMNTKSGPISVQELKATETHLLKWSQFHVNEDSLDKKLVAKKDEDSLFRAHGRLEDVRCLPEELRKPIILPKDHPFVILLLRDLHERRGHCGYKSLIHEARERF